MTSGISLNTTEILTLQNNARISASSLYNFQEANENTFEDVLLEEVTKQEEKNNHNKINITNLGKPAGFEMYENAREQNINPLTFVQMKSGINNYLMQN